ncbi:MAG: anhydro-N-acetylmuramic acid kinase [Streptosporangiales bacterium]|nr:anhydro-N-acetylmuramic acid kinase [Streptosporangiales bacterium]
MSLRVVGMISGTSYDAVEVAVADLAFDGDTVVATTRGTLSVEFPADLRARVAAALPPAATTLEEVCRLDTDLGRLFGAAAARGVRELAGGTADLVVSHGQTVYHWVEGRQALGTLQLGAAAWIAEACGCPVVSDLRTRDITRGGHGAPLVSLLDALLILAGDEPRGSLNLGGIANITLRRDGEVLAWDLGPANALIDAAVAGLTDGAEAMDLDGARAARGRVRDDLLARLLDEPYYALPAPKSTGKELFHAAYVSDLVALVERDSGVPVEPDDLVATLTELTAELVGRACRADALRELVVAGGGVRNPVLMARIRERCAPTELTTVEEYGLPSAAKEAYAFALLGFLTWHGLPATIPTATGASAPSVLGSITAGRAPLRLPAPAPAMPRRLVVLGP